MNRLSLKQTQEIFWQLTQEPEGVLQAVALVLKNADAGIHRLNQFIRGATEEEAIERMEIYSNMYFLRLHDVLKDNFRATRTVIGEEEFYKLCVGYLKKHPSKYYDISLIGRNLAPFIRENSLSDRYPYLADLACIESHRIDVFVEADAAVCRLNDLKSVRPEEWSDLQFQLIPAARIVSSQWQLMDFWRSFLKYESGSKAGGDSGPPSNDLIKSKPGQRQNILIWRKGFTVHFQSISDGEKTLLRGLEKPTRFEEICEMIVGQSEGEGNPETAARQLLKWLEEALLVLVS